MKFKMIKLAKMIMKLAEVETDKGTLIYEGELAEGVEVFVEKEGEIVPAEDGEYKVENRTIVVAEGKVAEIKEEEVVEEPAEEVEAEEVVEEPVAEDKTAELEAKVAELEALLAEKDARIAELEAIVAEQETKLQMSADESPKAKMKKLEREYKDNPALKYFEAIKK